MFSFVGRIKNVLKYSTQKYLKFRLQSVSFFAAKTSEDDRYMIVDVIRSKISSECEKLKYPLIWLRDNCQCSNCFHSQSKSRTIDWAKFDFKDAQPKSISIDKQLRVTWRDDHVSVFDFDWLLERSFTGENQKKYLDNHYRSKPTLWSKQQFEMKQFEANEVFENDGVLCQWLNTLTEYGVVIMKNAPLSGDQIRKFANRVGFIRKTQYGEEFFVRADPSATNVAYTSNPLQMHTDLPYYDHVPGVTLLHCISQTESPGAFNFLTDGFHTAEQLKKINPRAFECLTTTLVNWSDYGTEAGFRFEKIMRNPVICLDYEGYVKQINHSIPQRDSFFSIDVGQVDEWYSSLKIFVDLLYENAIYFKTEPGDILAFSNIRLLHGRTGYEDKNGNIRHIVGCYIDWDELYSRQRILANDKKIRH